MVKNWNKYGPRISNYTPIFNQHYQVTKNQPESHLSVQTHSGCATVSLILRFVCSKYLG